jgi:tRNA pseudouridine synthase 9
MLAKNKTHAQKVREKLEAQTVHKEYICRVLGTLFVKATMLMIKGEFPDANQDVTVNEPIQTVNFQQGLSAVSPDGKPSTTVFKRLHFDGRTSVVQCAFLFVNTVH